MIRINLLPDAKVRGRVSSGVPNHYWIVGYALVAALVIAVCAVLYVNISDEIETRQRQNQALETEIARLNAETKDLDSMRARYESSKELEAVVTELNRRRTGPTRVLMELSRILSVEGGPTVDEAQLAALREKNPLAGYNKDWDPRRLWLEALVELERSCTLRGKGKTNEDVAEFLRRLALSEMFDEVTLTKTEAKPDKETGAMWIEFELSTKLLY